MWWFVLLAIVFEEHQVSDVCFFFFQAEDGIRDLVRSRGLGDVYKRQRKLFDLVASIARLADSELPSADLEARFARLTEHLSLIHI